jgi:hypothetical protein
MRVLILTHPRSGSYPLANWLAKEINARVYIDPLEPIDDNHCVIRSVNLAEDLESYDCVIVHRRENTKETAISCVYVDTNPDYRDHDPYTITDQWITDHYEEIVRMEAECKAYNQMLSRIKREDLIHTSYEQSYAGNESIEAIAELIGMNKPFKYAEIIHHTKRYQTLGKWAGVTRGII